MVVVVAVVVAVVVVVVVAANRLFLFLEDGANKHWMFTSRVEGDMAMKASKKKEWLDKNPCQVRESVKMQVTISEKIFKLCDFFSTHHLLPTSCSPMIHEQMKLATITCHSKCQCPFHFSNQPETHRRKRSH